MSLRDQLQLIYEARGKLTPEAVVEEATAPNHPLHNRFEWNDALAAHEHRLSQARELIRSVKITYRRPNGDRAQVNRYQSVRRPEGSSYEDIEKIVEDDFTVKLLVADMRRDFETFKRRYQHLVEFVDLLREEVA